MLTIKLLGIALVVFTSSLIGFLKSRSLVARCKKLSLLCDGINALYEHIDGGGIELACAIKSSFSKCDFLRFENGRTLCSDNDLNGEDKRAVDSFFLSLGSSAKRLECDRINNFRLKIKTSLKEAENDASQKSKIYQTFGICIGLTVGILLI